MSDVANIDARNWILTLFIRDDGERFLLGDGAYEFKDSQQHFTAPTVENDTVEVQGNDGIMLAGQVRRPNTQEFDGFVGTAAATKEEIEVKRRAFLGFFLTRHTYTAIYIFNNGKAIQRRRGFLVDAPEVKELWQIHPEYHVALNFEDVNYYNYAENEQGEEIFSNLYKLINTRATSGGLVWDEIGVVWDEIQAGGKNLFDIERIGEAMLSSKSPSDVTVAHTEDNISVTATNGDSYSPFVYASAGRLADDLYITLKPNTDYTLSFSVNGGAEKFLFYAYDESQNRHFRYDVPVDNTTYTFNTGSYTDFIFRFGNTESGTTATYSNIQLEEGTEASSYEPFIPAGGAVWESGSGQNENLITVNSIDTVYPTLTIIGIASNIVIENSRTGDTLEYVGTVAAGQTLVIDMQNQTAKLNGVNVLGNITGDWLRLQPGQNRVIYDANTDDTSEATLEWQEIVG